jgi:RimJ/RimL family protein N-acetyltransferase
MKGVIQDDREARLIVESELGITISAPFSGLVFFEDKRPIGAAIFNHYDKWDVWFTCVLYGGDLGIRIARQVADYVFRQMDCHRCTAITARSNIPAQKALKQLGFKLEGIMDERFPSGEDGFVYGLLRAEQHFLRRL